MKLVEKTRIGSKLKRRYDKPQTPLERLLNCPQADPIKTEELKRLRDKTDPFQLAKRMEQKLERIYQMANHRISPSPQPAPHPYPTPHSQGKQTLGEISKIFATRQRPDGWKTLANSPSGGCPGKGQSEIVDPGAYTEEIFDRQQPNFQKASDSQTQTDLLLSSILSPTKRCIVKIRIAGLHSL